jgi:hypothetical protein
VTACRDFRARLAAALSERARPEDWSRLALEGHLMSCAPCRRLLDEEEALELILASWPRPVLPRDLARRVLARLAVARAQRPEGDRLDLLLEEAAAPEPPAGLAQQVLAGVEAEREAARLDRRLDRLLERVPAPAAPRDLAERVLGRLEGERRPRAAPWARRLSAPRPAYLAAAAAVLALLAWAWRAAREAPRAAPDLVARPEPDAALADPPAELLAALDVLENWELLVDEAPALDVLLDAPEESELLMLELERWSEAAGGGSGAGRPAEAPPGREGKG